MAPALTTASAVAIEGERRHDDLVAGPDAERPQSDRQRIGAVGDPDAVANAEIGGELVLESLDFRPEDVAAGLQHGPLARGDLSEQRLESRPGGEERDAHPRAVVHLHRQRSSRSSSGTSRTGAPAPP